MVLRHCPKVTFGFQKQDVERAWQKVCIVTVLPQYLFFLVIKYS